MDAALSVARSEGYKNIWLGVLKGNTRAEKFYQKFGFEKVGEHDFYLGSDRQTDDILVRSL
jgi:ribosomal protein S18 acetylase RimI-like enzyme